MLSPHPLAPFWRLREKKIKSQKNPPSNNYAGSLNFIQWQSHWLRKHRKHSLVVSWDLLRDKCHNLWQRWGDEGLGRWPHSDPYYCLTGRAGIPSCLDLTSLKNYSSLILVKLQRIGPCSLTGMKTGPNDTLHGHDLSRRLHKHEEMGRKALSWSVYRPKSDHRFIPEWSCLAANGSVSGAHTRSSAFCL